jgi:hypothetical protein
MRVEVVDEHHQVLRVRAADLGGRPHVRELLVLLAADHDQAVAVDELRVLDLAAFAFDEQLHLEAERLAQPVDRGARVLVPDTGGDAGPSRGCGLHAKIVDISVN